MTETTQRPFNVNFGFLRVLTLFVAELLVIHASRHVFGFECHMERYAFCNLARNLLLMSYSLAATCVILAFFAPRAWRDLLSGSELRLVPLGTNLAGLTILVVTLPALRLELTTAALMALAIIWAAGGAMLVGGGLLMLASREEWRRFLARMRWHLPVAIAAGAVAPFVALQIRPFWRGEVLADWTFSFVVRLLGLWGQPVQTDAASKVIGSGEFYVNIAPSCSGIEGIVLTTIFVGIYLMLFRQDLRFPQAFLILPIAIVLSWMLNALRIAILVQMGISGYPDLAVGGFHSHAGWLMFTVLALGILLATQSLHLFRRQQPAARVPPIPLRRDPVFMQIFPFIVFMASALLASTFSESPALVYPLRALVMACALGLAWPMLRALPWRLDPLALGSGAFIAAYWIVSARSLEGSPPFGDATGLMLTVWVVSRIVGTTFLVPVIEELFFRGYLLDRIAPPSAAPWRLVLGLVVTSVLFAVLHDRWIAGGLAGAILGLLVLRRRNLTDAIIAHGVANGLIAAWALTTGTWSII